METNKVICITLGINETKVLKFLNSIDKWFTFDEIHNQFKDINISLKYPKQLGPLLLRLLRKNLINRCETTDSYYYKINEKGKLILEVIKKDSDVTYTFPRDDPMYKINKEIEEMKKLKGIKDE